MKSWTDMTAALCAIVAMLAAGVAVGVDAPGESENLRIPLEYYEGGLLKTQVTASHAVMSGEREIRGKDVRIERFAPDGRTMVSRIIAENCRVDRVSREARSKGRVRYESRGMLITGSGFEWSSTNQLVIITNSPRVVLRKSIMWSGGKVP